MIAYDLKCDQGHLFEGWFEDADAFENQQTKGLVTCPVCDSAAVTRQLSTFAIKTSTGSGADRPKIDFEALGRRIVNYVQNNFDDVGSDFATEALKIHYGASEPRNIRGVSTDREERMLREEGVPYFKFPGSSKPPESGSGDDST
ncbi:MAG: DUF1178 family protein [Desulfosarcinaceae bacterium]|nr:DUF1178 family protein [Desulfosarcinaceae bacterium]